MSFGTPSPPAALPGLTGVRAEVSNPSELRRDDVITGDAVRLDLRPATVPIRAAAGFIDAVVVILLLIALSQLVSNAFSAMEESFGEAASLVMMVGLLVGFPVAVETLSHGRSLGKWACGLRVVRDDAGPIRLRHAVIRGLVGMVELWMSFGGIAALTSLINRRAKRMGDLLAGTYVVVERPPKQQLATVQMPPELAAWAGSADLARIPDTTAASARQLLGRLHRLAPGSAHHLLGSMAQQLSRYVAPGPPPGTPPDRFIAAVLAERRNRDYVRLTRHAQVQAERQSTGAGLPFGLR